MLMSQGGWSIDIENAWMHLFKILGKKIKLLNLLRLIIFCNFKLGFSKLDIHLTFLQSSNDDYCLQ